MKTRTYFLAVTGADPVLGWMCFFLLSGTIFWGIMLRILSKGFLGPATAQYPTGKPFSIFALQFPFSHSRLQQFLALLPPKALKPLLWSLKLDYLFMAFAYPFLACSAWYLLRNDQPSGFLAGYEATVMQSLRWGTALPFLAWLLDIVENLLLSSALRRLSFFKSRAILLANLLKWACVVFVVLLLLITGTNNFFS